MTDPIQKKAVLYFQSPLFKELEKKISYGFLTRSGRLSDGTQIDLDISQRPSNKTNSLLLYQIIADSFDILHKKPIFLSQPHKSEIAIIKDTPNMSMISGYDAVITTNREIIVNILTADCVPVLITNKTASFIAALHCGWKSLHANIIPRTVEKFMQMRIDPEDILVSAGPAIQSCCYEVKEEIRYKMNLLFNQDIDDLFTERESSLYFDLPGAVRKHFLISGIPLENIYINKKCTSHNKGLFFSNRRDKDQARLLNFISLSYDIQKNI